MFINKLTISNSDYLPPIIGRIKSISGNIISAYLPSSCVGDVCYIKNLQKEDIMAKVVSFDEDLVKLSIFENDKFISPHSTIKNTRRKLTIPFSGEEGNLIIDAIGNNLRGETKKNHSLTLEAASPEALKRKTINKIMKTGISAIDGICSIGKGQRVGLFAPPGVGKSTLLGMICRNSNADINVVALVGERGREVNDFLLNTLKDDGLKNTILVISTSDENSMLRATAPLTATAIAEYFRSQGKDVLLMIDSLTRYARATREIGLSAGEMPIRQGYPPSLYIDLAKLVERAGTSDKGSITGIYTVLENDEKDIDPLSEEVKSLLDGHIVLQKQIADMGIRPSISILDSTSRLIDKIHSSEYLKTIQVIRKVIKILQKEKDLLLLGATPSKELKVALRLECRLNDILNQQIDEKRNFDATLNEFSSIAREFLSELG
ncbi:MAG: FliI/YscN family ATPase [Bdellovibrionota bacterium]